jgi:uncharacterized membrane protein YbhN (UPF0104 family)
VFGCVVWALDIPAGWAASGLSLAAATLATLLPSSPGYVGTFDYFAALGLTAHGITPAAATAFALLVHLLLWAPVTLFGLIALILRGPGGAPVAVPSQHFRAGSVAP